MPARTTDNRVEPGEVINGSTLRGGRGLPSMRLKSPARASLSARPPASSAREFYSVGLGSPAASCNATTPLHRMDRQHSTRTLVDFTLNHNVESAYD